MKKEGRTILLCRKELGNGVMETFEVVVGRGERDTAKRNYESQGYTVSTKK